jgi:glutathione synthase
MVFVVDPIESLNPAHDSSVALMEAVQARGHTLLVTTASQLGVHDGRATARCVPLNIRPAVLDNGRWRADGHWFTAGEPRTLALEDTHAVFMRTDPPVDSAYLRATYLLDFVDTRRTVLVNAPAGLRHANEKLFTLQFPDLTPPTLVSASRAEIEQFVDEVGEAVLKPTDLMAGRGIMIMSRSDRNLRSILDSATERGRTQVVVQRFIPDSAAGDRRIILVDGTPVGAIRRVAPQGEFRCNMATGASIHPDDVTDGDQQICARLAPELRRLGLPFVGIDVIGGFLTEVNVTSPTGLRELEALCETPAAEMVLSWVTARIAASGTDPGPAMLPASRQPASVAGGRSRNSPSVPSHPKTLPHRHGMLPHHPS